MDPQKCTMDVPDGEEEIVSEFFVYSYSSNIIDFMLSRCHSRMFGEMDIDEARTRFLSSLDERNSENVYKILDRLNNSNYFFNKGEYAIFSSQQAIQINPLVEACKIGNEGRVRDLLVYGHKRYHSQTIRDAMLESARWRNHNCLRVLAENRLLCSKFFRHIYPCMEDIKSGKYANVLDYDTKAFYGESDYHSTRTGKVLLNVLILHGCPPTCLTTLANKGVDLSSYDYETGLTPLMCALLAENSDCLQFLLDSGVDLNIADCHNEVICMREYIESKTALMYAACLRDTKGLEMMLPFCQMETINACTRSKKTPLWLARLYGNETAVTVLLESGATTDVTEDFILDALLSGRPNLVRFVQSKVSNESLLPVVKRKPEYLVLHADCLRAFLETVFVKLDAIFCHRMTLLTLAASKGTVECVQLLLEKGAGVDYADESGNSALIMACMADKRDIVNVLLDHGANINFCSQRGYTPIMHAVDREKEKVVQRLLSADADLNYVTEENDTVFTLAMRKQNCAIVELLLNQGEVLEHGCLKSVHRNAMIRARTKENFILPLKTLMTAANCGLFDWGWCSSFTFRSLAFVAVYSGMCPGKIRFNGLAMYPLVLAFSQNEVSVVKYFLANLYFHLEDYRMLAMTSSVRDLVAEHDSKELTSLLDLVCLQPLSLLTWSILAVSGAISRPRPAGLRRQLVDSLPLPDCLTRRLNFQTDASRLCRNSWSHLDIDPGLDTFSLPEEEITNCTFRCYQCGGLGKMYKALS